MGSVCPGVLAPLRCHRTGGRRIAVGAGVARRATGKAWGNASMTRRRRRRAPRVVPGNGNALEPSGEAEGHRNDQ
jgi:hypothetical protein